MPRNPRNLRIAPWLLWAAVAAPPAAIIVFQWKYTLMLPFMDSWELVPYLQRAHDRTLRLGELFDQHNGHRIAVARTVLLGLALVSHWSHPAEVAVIRVVGVLNFSVWLVLIRQTTSVTTPNRLVAAYAIASIGTFSLAAWRNWIWGWQLAVLFCALFALAAIACLASRLPIAVKLPLAAAFALCGTYSFAAGFAIWPAALLLLLADPSQTRRQSVVIAVVWTTIAMIAFAVYIHGFDLPPDATEFRSLATLLSIPSYVLAFIGAGLFAASPPAAVALGAVGTAAWGAVLLRMRGRGLSRAMPLVAVAAFTFVAGVATAAGRAEEGIVQAVASRYTTLSAPFWIALALVLMQLPASPAIVQWVRRCAVAIGVLLALNTAAGFYAGSQRADYDNAARPALIAGEPVADLVRLYPDTDVLLERRIYLQKNHLSVFRMPAGRDQP